MTHLLLNSSVFQRVSLDISKSTGQALPWPVFATGPAPVFFLMYPNS